MFSVEFDANIALPFVVPSGDKSPDSYVSLFWYISFTHIPGNAKYWEDGNRAMLAGVGRNHPNDHFLQIPRVDNVARCYVCELVPGLKNAMLDFTRCIWLIYLPIFLKIFLDNIRKYIMKPLHPHYLIFTAEDGRWIYRRTPEQRVCCRLLRLGFKHGPVSLLIHRWFTYENVYFP